MVPVYLASLMGPEIFEPTPGKWRPKIFFHAVSFVIGFAVIFTLIGAGLGLAGFAIGEHLALMRNISGSLLVFFGIFLLVSLKVPQLNFEKRLKPGPGKTAGYARSLLTGGLFALAWTPCVGPILGSILTLAISSQTVYQGAGLLAVFSLGVGLPFMAIGAAFDTLNPFLKKIQRYSFIFYIISSVLLIGVGILILTNHLAILQGAATTV
jgi:cytochrome c-type biogenesis protein